MTVTIHDIQIFVTTHNRASLLKETLENLLTQTAGIKHITVLDNESTDHTSKVVHSFAPLGVEYVSTTGFLGNFNKARTLVNKPYCMLFHDDDLLHPQYLQTVLKLLNIYPSASLVTCAYTPFSHTIKTSFPQHLKTQYLAFKTPRQWACYMYFFEGISYAPAVYRTDAFLKNALEYEKFNKFNDWPFMAKCSLYGPVLFIIDPNCIYCRQHPGQDSNNSQNFPNLGQIVNWDKCFFTLMGSPSWKDPLYWIYGEHNKHFLVGKYNAAPQILKSTNSIQDLKRVAKQAGLPVWGLGSIGPFKHMIHFFARKLKAKLSSRIQQI